MANKKPASKKPSPKLALASKSSGPHRPPVVPSQPPKMAPPGRRVKVMDANGRQRFTWEQT